MDFDDHADASGHANQDFNNFDNHGNTSHVNNAHANTTFSNFTDHGNMAHSDGNPHGNQAFQNANYQQHNDSYYDSYEHQWHDDNAHMNTPHGDMSGHYNDPHADTNSHSNVAHNDSHGDTAFWNFQDHTNTTHADNDGHSDFSNHNNVSHKNVPFSNGTEHLDTDHGDTAFVDTPFLNSSTHTNQFFEDFSNHSNLAFGDAVFQNYQDTSLTIDHSDHCDHSNTAPDPHENNYQDTHANSTIITPGEDPTHNHIEAKSDPFQDIFTDGHSNGMTYDQAEFSDSFTDMPFCNCSGKSDDPLHLNSAAIPEIKKDHCNSGGSPGTVTEKYVLDGEGWIDPVTGKNGCPPSTIGPGQDKTSVCTEDPGDPPHSHFWQYAFVANPDYCNDPEVIIQAAVPHGNSYGADPASLDFDAHFNVKPVGHGDAPAEASYSDYSDDFVHINSYLDHGHYNSAEVGFTDKEVHCNCTEDNSPSDHQDHSDHSDVTPHVNPGIPFENGGVPWNHIGEVPWAHCIPFDNANIPFDNGGVTWDDCSIPLPFDNNSTPHGNNIFVNKECDCTTTPQPDPYTDHADQPYTLHGNQVPCNDPEVPFQNKDHCNSGVYTNKCTTKSGSAGDCPQSSPKCEPMWCHAILTGDHEGPGPEYKPIPEYQTIFTQHVYTDSSEDPKWCNTPAEVIQTEIPHCNKHFINEAGSLFQNSTWHCNCIPGWEHSIPFENGVTPWGNEGQPYSHTTPIPPYDQVTPYNDHQNTFYD